MMKKVTKAVIPAAGLGTRVLPATKAMPKGMLPIVDKPAIQYLVEEAVRSGITDILIILGRNQSIIEDHFDRSPELEEKLAKPGKEKALEECLGIANMANIFFVRQKQTLGLGHAVNTAKAFTGDDPFVVIYGDDVIWGEDPVCAQLIRAYEEFGRPVAGVSAVPWEDVSRYCSLKTTPIHDNYFFVDDMIEKPKKGQEFSNYSILGRVLPATKAMPKGMLPIVDKPAIQYLVEEAVRSGITDILIILGRNQSVIEDHFDRSPELEEKLAAPGKEKMLEECLGISNLANIYFVRQKQTLGLGHAVSMAKPFTGDDPFVVIYGDDVIWGEDPVCAQLIRAYEEFGRPVAGVSAVPWADVSRYCSLKTTPIHDNYFFVDDMIEKPKKGQEFSNYSILGRVLLTPEIYDIPAHTKPGAGGEIQLTDAMAEYARNHGGMTAVEFTGKHYDMGNKLKVVEAQVELALQHPEIGEEFRAYLKEFCKTL